MLKSLTPRRAALTAALTLTLGSLQPASAAYKALYGSDGNDFYTFAGSNSVANMKTSGWNGLILFAFNVTSSGDLQYNGNTIVTNGNYVGNANWGANVTALKTPPTTVYRYEVGIGGASNASFTNIRNLIASQGTGSTSILYRNFLALKNAVPGINAINDDDELTFDQSSTVAFANMLDGLGMKFSLAPYNNQGFWVAIKNALGHKCDIVYLQCYQGGAGNNPASWSSAFASDGSFKVVPGIESNNHSQTTFANWASSTAIGGGFYWPDVTWSPGANWGVNDIEGGVGWVPNGSNGGYVCEVGNLKSSLNVSPSGGGTSNGTDVVQTAYAGIDQRCKVTWVQSPATYTVACNSSGKTIGVASGSTTAGAHVQINDYSGASYQKLQFVATSGWPGYFTMKFVHDGQAMGVYNGSTAAGAQIIQYTVNNANDQQWQIRYNYDSGW